MLHPHDDSHAYQFCPRCGGPLERRMLKAGEPERLVCARCGFVFYLDPKIAVGTIIRSENDRLVLVRRAIEPGYGKWVFPGGYVDRGEPLTSAAVREAHHILDVLAGLRSGDVAAPARGTLEEEHHKDGYTNDEKKLSQRPVLPCASR